MKSLRFFWFARLAVAAVLVFWPGARLDAQVPGQAPLIQEINVQFVGPTTLSKQRVLDNLATKPGAPYNDRLVEEDIKSLYATGQVSNARIFAEPITGGLKVTVLLQGRATVGEVIIEGADAIPNSKIRKEIATKPGEPLSDERLNDDRQKILKLYEDKNYTDVKVDTKSTELPDKKMKVAFLINEGPKLVIRRISFTGNDSVLPKDLMKVMKTKTANLLSFLTKAGRLTPFQMDEDKEAIRTLYQSKGFADMRVSDVQTTPLPNGKGVDLVISISEGTQYRVNKLDIDGATIVAPVDLVRYLKMRTGSLYTPDGMGADLKKIRDYYGSRGYVDMVAQPQITPAGQGQIDLTYRIDEGVQSYVNLINVQGNTKTKDKVIRRELAVQPGGIFDTTLVDVSKTRLMNLNYFSKVDTVPVDTLVPGRKDLDVIVDEKKTGSFNFGAGFSSIDSLVGFAEMQQSNFDLFNWPNFTGAGQRFRIRGQYGLQRQDFTMSLTEPWFMGYKVSVGGEFYYHAATFLSPVYSQSNLGGALQARKALTPFTALRGEYRLENININNLTGNYGNGQGVTPQQQQQGAIQNAANNSPYTKSCILLGIDFDNRDSLFLTRKGQSINLTGFVAGGGLGGTVQDYGISLDAKKYFSLPWDMILLTKGSVGVVNTWGSGTQGTNTPPIFDELYLGGANDMRGFVFRGVGPKDFYGNPVGGSTSVYGTAELTFPIIPRLRGAIFTDWGYVNANAWDINPQSVTTAANGQSYTSGGLNGDVGIGARIELPIGPIRVDWGYPVMTDSWNRTSGQFQFNVGYTF
ncbi:MAG: outer membrane protein assembly factor BamA [Verrucomicrobiota bacterium]